MQSYDVLMLLVLVAAGLWGYWKGFVWQLASLASIFFSYFAAFGLRVQVAKLIDADPPWNMFAAMGIVYLLSSLGIWIATAFTGTLLEGFKLRDFDRQIGATFGVAKGVIFCVLITFFGVTLLGPREQERICGSTSGRYIAKLLKSSAGLIPQEIHAAVDPFLTPFQETLEQHQGEVAATDWSQSQLPQQPGPQVQSWLGQGAAAWNQNYAPQPPAPYGNGYASYQQPQYAPPQQQYHPAPAYQPQYTPGGYDPRYAQPANNGYGYQPPQYAPPANDPRYQPAPQYTDPRYQNYGYQEPRYNDPQAYPPPADPRGYNAPPPQYNTPQQPPPQQAYDPSGAYR